MVLFEVLGRTAQETDAIARAVESALAAEGTEGAVRRFAEVSPDVLASWGVRELPFVRRENRVLCQGRIPGPDEIRAWLRLPRTVDEAVAWLLAEIGDDDLDTIRGKAPDDLVDLHPTFGLMLRNRLGLWGDNPELLASCGCGTVSADDASSVIVQALWERLRRGES